jgi:hypothetical protein
MHYDGKVSRTVFCISISTEIYWLAHEIIQILMQSLGRPLANAGIRSMPAHRALVFADQSAGGSFEKRPAARGISHPCHKSKN